MMKNVEQAIVNLKNNSQLDFNNCQIIEFTSKGFVIFKKNDGTMRAVNKDEIIDISWKLQSTKPQSTVFHLVREESNN